ARWGRLYGAADGRGASCHQERTGGALGGGKKRARALRTGAGSTGRGVRAPLVARRSAAARRPANGALRKWQSAQSGGWIRAQGLGVLGSAGPEAWAGRH